MREIIPIFYVLLFFIFYFYFNLYALVSFLRCLLARLIDDYVNDVFSLSSLCCGNRSIVATNVSFQFYTFVSNDAFIEYCVKTIEYNLIPNPSR
jgi:hypothetical protein